MIQESKQAHPERLLAGMNERMGTVLKVAVASSGIIFTGKGASGKRRVYPGREEE